MIGTKRGATFGGLGLLAALVVPAAVACSGGDDASSGRAGDSSPGGGAGASPSASSTTTSSPDGGTTSPSTPVGSDAGSDGATQGPPGQVKGLVGVGYGGLRITSRDNGQTWGDHVAAANGGLDDYDLLRAVAWANGKWLAVGWCATTSTDGVTWTPLKRINEAAGVKWNGASDCGLVEGLTSDGSYFYAACASYNKPHHVYRSDDGENWTDFGMIGAVGGHPALAYRAGEFYAYGDPKTSFRSTDASTWTIVPGLEQATFCEGTWKSKTDCHDASWFGGAYYLAYWQSKVARSTDGNKFDVVHDDPSNNTLYQPRAMAEGWVAP